MLFPLRECSSYCPPVFFLVQEIVLLSPPRNVILTAQPPPFLHATPHRRLQCRCGAAGALPLFLRAFTSFLRTSFLALHRFGFLKGPPVFVAEPVFFC